MNKAIEKLKFILLVIFISGVHLSFDNYHNDFVAPVISASSIINNTTGTQFTLRVQVDQPSTTVYYVVNTADTNPSAAEIKAGQISGGGSAPISGNFAVAAAATNTDQVIAGLTAGTTYYINFISENGGAEKSGVSELNPTATDATA